MTTPPSHPFYVAERCGHQHRDQERAVNCARSQLRHLPPNASVDVVECSKHGDGIREKRVRRVTTSEVSP